MGTSDASAFDDLAHDYDRAFTRSCVGAFLRGEVWRRLEACLPPCASVLELGCGTGEDAVWLARAGHRVVAIDASAEMIRVARLKAVAAGCADRIEFHCLSMEALESMPGETRFDAAVSNFGAINCVRDVSSLMATLASRLAPGAVLAFVVMGRYVPWEWIWHLARGQWSRAFRRLGRDGADWRGMRITYPTPAMLAASFEPHFTVTRVAALGCVLPPSYAAAWLERSPRMFKVLAGLERRLGTRAALAPLGDHYLLEARHTDPSPASLIERHPRRLWRSLAKRIVDVFYAVTGRRRYDDYRLERVRDLRLLVLPSVSNPKALRTGEFFAQAMEGLSIGDQTSVLDLGTGSGVCALQAARQSRSVVAVDINEAAVRCARINAAINGLEHRIDVRAGDLFGPVRGMRFHLVLFNPPFCSGMPRDARDAAWRSADLPLRFARDLDAHLEPGGQALLLLSSWGDACPRFELELARQGFALSVFAVRRHLDEIVTIVRIQRP